MRWQKNTEKRLQWSNRTVNLTGNRNVRMTESKQTEIISRIDEAVSGRKQNKQQNKQHDYCEITAGRLIARFTAILRLLMSKENQKPFHSENVPGILN